MFLLNHSVGLCSPCEEKTLLVRKQKNITKNGKETLHLSSTLTLFRSSLVSVRHRSIQQKQRSKNSCVEGPKLPLYLKNGKADRYPFCCSFLLIYPQHKQMEIFFLGCDALCLSKQMVKYSLKPERGKRLKCQIPTWRHGFQKSERRGLISEWLLFNNHNASPRLPSPHPSHSVHQ